MLKIFAPKTPYFYLMQEMKCYFKGRTLLNDRNKISVNNNNNDNFLVLSFLFKCCLLLLNKSSVNLSIIILLVVNNLFISINASDNEIGAEKLEKLFEIKEAHDKDVRCKHFVFILQNY